MSVPVVVATLPARASLYLAAAWSGGMTHAATVPDLDSGTRLACGAIPGRPAEMFVPESPAACRRCRRLVGEGRIRVPVASLLAGYRL